jgi:hypothetical protein
MDINSEQYRQLTRFMAYLDTLHDFCGPRNKLVSKREMINYMRHAFEYKSVNDVYPVIQGINEPLHSRLKTQINELFDYGAGSFNTFEQNTFDFAAAIDRYYKGNIENVIEIDVKKNVFDRRLKDISLDYILYDTSVLSYEYICNVLNKHITVTMATNWDGDGNNTNVDARCRDDRLGLEFALEKRLAELSSLDRIVIKDDKIYAVLGGNSPHLSWQRIQNDLSKLLNVKTYAMHMSKPTTMMQTFKDFLQIPAGVTKIGTGIVGRITDVKRSGDWMQLQAMEPLDNIHKNMVLYTVDTPLAARCLLKRRVSIVTNKRPGKDTVNVRIVGNVQMNDSILLSKQQENAEYDNTIARSWIKNADPEIKPLLSLLGSTITNLIRRGWNKVELHVLDDTLVKKDLGYNTFSIEKAIQQKKNEVLLFLIEMLVTLSHIHENTREYGRLWDTRFAARRQTAQRQKRSVSASSEQPTRQTRQKQRGGMGKDDFMVLLERTQSKKTFFTEELRLQAIERMSALVKENLIIDIGQLERYVYSIPNNYNPEFFDTVQNKAGIDDKCSISGGVYNIMMELYDIMDLMQYTSRTAVINYGRTEADYDKFVSTINNSYESSIAAGKTILSYQKPLVTHYLGLALNEKSTIKTIMNFVTIVATLKKGGAITQIDKRTDIIITPEENLRRESPFIQAVFARPEYLSSDHKIYRIPVIDYLIAILIRDMFFEKFKNTCFSFTLRHGERCHRAPDTRTGIRHRSAPTPVRSERPVLNAPLSASVGRRRTPQSKSKRPEKA